ncbi:transcription factor kayak isoform X3 [Bombyx mandarina]|uniref:BZIP domain-containing protein n=2 Tax=Bombyx TaxID=7090 RepID=A0A8R1WGW8_BOMMO|nr:transcription factor kayak isoform X3 [Bombyx mori]XP_028040727.1 transcription factor kayak isoform X3 [Bombyx mandarina]
MQNIDPLEIANILATELWCQQLANLEGLQSGVPTRTTATITPTQLRNFEQTYIELTNCRSEPTTHVGFVPPSVTHANNYGILNSVGYCDSGPTTALHVSPGPLSASGDSSSSPGLPAPKRRNMGGRRPNKAPQELSPEEEERRKIRRERNKMAAARCRKRRLDHTNELQDETDRLEQKRQSLQEEIRKLNADREHLQTILQNHMITCRLSDRSSSPPDVKPLQEVYTYPDPEDGVRVKTEVIDPTVDPVMLGLDNIFTTPSTEKRIMLSSANPGVVTSGDTVTLDTPPAISRPNRPNSLQVPLSLTPAQIHNNKVLGNSKIAGIEISTPSNGMFNYESLMDGGTGLTPVLPHPLGHAHAYVVPPRPAPPGAADPPELVSL